MDSSKKIDGDDGNTNYMHLLPLLPFTTFFIRRKKNAVATVSGSEIVQ